MPDGGNYPSARMPEFLLRSNINNERNMEKIEQLKNLIEEVTGENSEDVLGGDRENIDQSFNECSKCGGEMSSKMAGDESYKHCSDCGFMDAS